jgi:hypothetical protein
MDLLKKIEVQIFSFLLFFVFSLMDTMLIFNHYIKYLAVKQTREAPRGVIQAALQKLRESDTDFRQIILRSSLSSLLFLQEKKVDPNDFSPCIKQKTIITVEFIFF